MQYILETPYWHRYHLTSGKLIPRIFWCYMQSAQEKWIVTIEFVPGESNIADVMTKSVCSVTAYRLHRDHMCHGLWGSVRECQFTSCDH